MKIFFFVRSKIKKKMAPGNEKYFNEAHVICEAKKTKGIPTSHAQLDDQIK